MGHRRLDAFHHNPGAARIRKYLTEKGRGTSTIAECGYRVWVPGRYKRIPAEDGVIYRDSSDILEATPNLEKRFADCDFGDDHRGRVEAGWILMPCSGQTYGIIGSVVQATDALSGQVVSNHAIRVAPRSKPTVAAGYIVTALSHPVLGRPLLKALAFGSSVPEIDTGDIINFRVVRLEPNAESRIHEIAKASAEARSAADLLERAIADDASSIVHAFMNRTSAKKLRSG